MNEVMDIPDDLVDKLKIIKNEFPDVFDGTNYVDIRWNIKDDIFILTVNRNNTMGIVIK